MKNSRFIFYPLLLLSLATFSHFWITQPLFWEKLPYRLQAYQLAFTHVECDKSAPNTLSNLLRFHSLPNFALTGEVVYINRSGEASLCSVSPDGLHPNKYRLASMTKAITAHAAYKLEQRGELDTNARLLDYFPEVDVGSLRDAKLKDVTIAQLLNHSSGFGGFFGSDNMVNKGEAPWCPYRFDSLESVRLAGRPGTNHVYSNVAYCLVGEVISRVTGAPYRQYIREHYLANTTLDFVNGGYLPGEPPYDFSNESRFKRGYVDWLDFNALSSSAGLIGPPAEFAKMVWKQMHVDARALLHGSRVPGCGGEKIPVCYSRNFELAFDEQGKMIAGVQRGYMPGVSSMLAVTEDGQVLVWVAAGTAIESRFKDDMQRAAVEFLQSRRAINTAG